ncbi:MAG: hypothetical protein J6M18_04670 [Actinomycetaceae bacterium]|nr:hypothetical protein [Actinomycetaceae bacterium]
MNIGVHNWRLAFRVCAVGGMLGILFLFTGCSSGNRFGNDSLGYLDVPSSYTIDTDSSLNKRSSDAQYVTMIARAKDHSNIRFISLAELSDDVKRQDLDMEGFEDTCESLKDMGARSCDVRTIHIGNYEAVGLTVRATTAEETAEEYNVEANKEATGSTYIFTRGEKLIQISVYQQETNDAELQSFLNTYAEK